jgi:ATP-dependent helicase HepA
LLNDFTPGQRWISSTEPELGLGIITEVDFNRITMLFLATGDKRVYAKNNAPLIRVRFSVGDEIEDTDNNKLTVKQCIEKDDLISYVGVSMSGQEVQIDELDLNHHTQFSKPQDRLFTGQFDPSQWYHLRYATWQRIQRSQQSPVRGLIGARAALLPHQIYIAHEAANRPAPRVMLADEVGLGKTIEAGLILQYRLINDLSNRILIIVPESLLHQWLVEMLRRFNLHFSIFDQERCNETHTENPFLAEQLVLCSLDFFQEHPERQQEALQAEWDLVVVDEAHHLQWSEQNPSPEYQFIEALGQKSPGLILLSATPEQLGKESHFARLRLLDPDRFYNFSDFLKEDTQFEPIAEAASMLADGEPLTEETQNFLKTLLKQDGVEDLLEKVVQPEQADSARSEILQLLIDHHGTGRILFRNSRQTVGGFPERECHSYALTETKEAGEGSAILDDPRYSWLVEKMGDLGDQKAVLICHQAETAVELGQTLKNKAGIQAAIFHEGLTIIERDRAAAYFADPESQAQLLICSEIGSEGRNFQFVHHLILFDLPENPDLLQQRIGRLDRIGQEHVIQIHVPYIKNTPTEILFHWYARGLNAFRVNCSAAPKVYEQQSELLKQRLDNNDHSDLDLFIKNTAELTKELEQHLHDGRDQLLELNSCRKDQAETLIQQIESFKPQSLWEYMEQTFDCYGVEYEYHSVDCQILKPSDHLRVSHFPYLPEDGTTITINRVQALAREDMQFLTWEHPMVMAAMDLTLSSETGNASVSIVKHPQLSAGQFVLEILFIIECSAPSILQAGRFLPPTPVRVLIDQEGQDLSQKINHGSLVEVDTPIEKDQITEFLIGQKKHINTLLETGKEIAGEVMNITVQESIETMLEVMSNEIKRLVRLKKINLGIKVEEIEYLQNMTRELNANIQEARLKMDAVRFLIVS